MASDLRDELTCSICLNIYTDPVTLTCGHSFCKNCIEDAMEAKEGPGAYKCPECRMEYKDRPALEKNRKLSNIAETFRSSQPEQEDIGILCTYCDSLVPAVKTCLLCETSLCEKHVTKHNKLAEHVLMDPTASLENRKCPIHKKVLEYYCLEDATCVCVSCCLIGEHSGHQMESLHEASEKKKAKMQNILGRLISEKTKKEERIQSLQDASRDLQNRIAGLTGETTALFMGLKEQLETLEKQVLSQINQYRVKSSNMKLHQINQLKIKRDELSRNVSHIEELCDMTDPLAVIQSDGTYETKSDDDGRRPVEKMDNEEESDKVDDEDNQDDGESDEDYDEDDDEVDVAVGEFGLIFAILDTGLDEVVTWAKRQCKAEAASDKFLNIDMTSSILLDVNTAGNHTDISVDGNTISFSKMHRRKPHGPERFKIPQVLSTTGFSSGKHYWKVEGSPSGGWRVGVTYSSINRKGKESPIGNNGKSCAMMNANNQYIAIHNGQSVLLPVTPSCYRLGIFLDYESGQLSFYELGDPIRHLYTFMGSFTEPLHIAIYVEDHGWVRIRTLNEL